MNNEMEAITGLDNPPIEAVADELSLGVLPEPISITDMRLENNKLYHQMVAKLSALAAPVALALNHMVSEKGSPITEETAMAVALLDGIKIFAGSDPKFVKWLLSIDEPRDIVHAYEAGEGVAFEGQESLLETDFNEQEEPQDEVIARLRLKHQSRPLPTAKIQRISSTKSLETFGVNLVETTVTGANYYGLRAVALNIFRSLPHGKAINMHDFRTLMGQKLKPLGSGEPSPTSLHAVWQDLEISLLSWSNENEAIEIVVGPKKIGESGSTRLYARHYSFTPPATENNEVQEGSAEPDLLISSDLPIQQR